MNNQVVIPIDLHFDVEKLVEIYYLVQGHIKESWDKQISITSSTGTDLFESVGRISTLSKSEKDYDVLNHKFLNTYLEQVHTTLLSKFNVIRGRIMLLSGKTCYTYHRDPTWRLHVPIITNNDSVFIVDDIVYRLSNSGQVYLVNTTLFHSAINMKDEDRVHLVYGLASENI